VKHFFREPHAWLAFAATCVAVGACTTILGNDFEIVGGTAGAGAVGGQSPNGGGGTGADGGNVNGGGGSGGDGGDGGIGGEGPGPIVCEWADVRQLDTLAGLPAGQQNYNGGQIHMLMSDNNARLLIARNNATGSIVELWSIDEDGDAQVRAFPGYGSEGGVRVDGSHVAALIMNNTAAAAGRMGSLLVVDDSDSSGMNATLTQVFAEAGDVTDMAAGIASTGDGVVALAYSYRLNGQPYRAKFKLTSVSGPPVEFDNSSSMMSLGSGDYEIGAFVRDGNDNHILLGEDFEGASMRRQFVLPDTVAGITAPVRQVPVVMGSPTFMGIHPRTTGDYLIGYAEFGSSLKLRLGVIDATEIETHEPADIPEVIELGAGSVPNGEAAFAFTENGFFLLGYDEDSPLGLRATVIHRQSGIRSNEFLPYPDPSIFPANFTLQRVEAVITSGLLDTVFGADIIVTFFITDDDLGHDELYSGRLECTAR
jgi:hypothetical protein